MTSTFQNTHFSKAFFCMAVVLLTGIYSCNDSRPKEDKTEMKMDTAVSAPMDTSSKMKMMADTATTDTSHKGGQPLPPKK